MSLCSGNQVMIPLTDGDGHANDGDHEAQRQKEPQADELQSDTKSFAILLLIGIVGSLWRFPYVYLKHGGGTFFIPYMVVICLVGYPLLVMEIGIGQKLRLGSITIWTTINPQLGGIGIVICLATIAMSCNYGIVMAWCYKYVLDRRNFQNSLLQPDPKRLQTFWHKNVLNVTNSMDEFSEIQEFQVFSLLAMWIMFALLLPIGFWLLRKCNNLRLYYNPDFGILLMIGSGYIVSLMLITIYIFQSGYSYVSFLYITSVELKDLLVLPIWIVAVIQVFCSLSLVHGSWILLGSAYKRNNNVLLLAVMVISCSCIIILVWTWFIVSLIIPNVLQDIKTCVIGSAHKWNGSEGMLTHAFTSIKYDALIASRILDDMLTNFDVQECNMENQFKLASNGIIFTALERLTMYEFTPFGHFFNSIQIPINFPQVYLMCICSISLVFSMWCFALSLTEVECFKKIYETCITIMLCMICAICGLVFRDRTGVYWFSLYNDILLISCLTLLALCEILIMVFIYGYQQYVFDIYDMTGHTISGLFIFISRHITPVSLLLTFLSILTIGLMDGFRYEVWTHNSNFLTMVRYPHWAQAIVWAITGVCLLLILSFCMVDSRPNLSSQLKESFSKINDATGGTINRSDTCVAGKEVITEMNFDNCPNTENDEDIDNSTAQVPVHMYKIVVLDSWKSAGAKFVYKC